MLGWRKQEEDAAEAELREATLKRLAEVLGLPAEDFEAVKALKQGTSNSAPEITTEPQLSGGY